jgi:ribosome-binding protein aMBF1 (putative translation factor)
MREIIKTLSDATNFDELLDIKYGKLGTEKRDDFEAKSKAYIIGEMIKEARKESKLTQEELAKKTGTKKSYISRLENGKIDIQISTLFKIFEEGLGKRLGFTIF